MLGPASGARGSPIGLTPLRRRGGNTIGAAAPGDAKGRGGGVRHGVRHPCRLAGVRLRRYTLSPSKPDAGPDEPPGLVQRPDGAVVVIGPGGQRQRVGVHSNLRILQNAQVHLTAPAPPDGVAGVIAYDGDLILEGEDVAWAPDAPETILLKTAPAVYALWAGVSFTRDIAHAETLQYNVAFALEPDALDLSGYLNPTSAPSQARGNANVTAVVPYLPISEPARLHVSVAVMGVEGRDQIIDYSSLIVGRIL